MHGSKVLEEASIRRPGSSGSKTNHLRQTLLGSEESSPFVPPPLLITQTEGGNYRGTTQASVFPSTP